jgi:hypothetical protein
MPVAGETGRMLATERYRYNGGYGAARLVRYQRYDSPVRAKGCQMPTMLATISRQRRSKRDA